MLPRSLRLATFALLAAAGGTAFAHTGVDGGSHHGAFLQGLLHPWTGLDHLAAMLAVGVWSALVLGRPQVWQAPLAFVAMLVVGALAGFAGVEPPLVEPMIAASLLVLGLFVTVRQRLPLTAMLMVVGGFALFHGVAHGVELARGESIAALAALAGMVLSTAALHLAGVGLGHALLARHRWQQALGGGVALFGGYSLLQLVA